MNQRVLYFESHHGQLRYDVGYAEQARKGQDVLLVDMEREVYGVFDGIGSHQKSERSSRLAALAVHNYFADAAQPEPPRVALVHALERAHREIIRDNDTYGYNGGTTATAAKLVVHSKARWLAWASVGDSRLYVRNGKHIECVTADETAPGRPNVLTNALGDSFRGVRQSGVVQLKRGADVLLVTDGVTGDKGDDVLEDRELENVLARTRSARSAAEMLIDISRKLDDKAAVALRLLA